MAKEEAAMSLVSREPTGRLLDAAVRSMPSMVMDKFHNVQGGSLAHRFYELTGRGQDKVVRLSPELCRIAGSTQAAGLRSELEARWSIVEASFTVGVGRSLMEQGLAVDLDAWRLVADLRQRRRSVAGVREAVIGFQHGRCMTCGDVIGPADEVDIDHVFGFALMRHYQVARMWPGLDFDAVWNLAPAHRDCNGSKSARLPTTFELRRLVQRNEAIMKSPHPLKRTLEISLGSYAGTSGGWPAFTRAVLDLFT